MLARGEGTMPFWKISTNAAAKCIPRAELVVLPNIGHMGPADDPEAVSAAVVRFVDSQ
jgi:pimeloyl-ACP methyl ester carboxylesterase